MCPVPSWLFEIYQRTHQVGSVYQPRNSIGSVALLLQWRGKFESSSLTQVLPQCAAYTLHTVYTAQASIPEDIGDPRPKYNIPVYTIGKCPDISRSTDASCRHQVSNCCCLSERYCETGSLCPKPDFWFWDSHNCVWFGMQFIRLVANGG